MAEGTTRVKERQRQLRRNCRHHWIIESPHGATSRGTCKRCGMSKRFPNASAENTWDAAGAGASRWSGRRQLRPTEISVTNDEEDEG